MADETDIPPMPDDWWPDITVIGKDGERELGFAITKGGFQSIDSTIIPSINALLESLWKAKHNPEFYAEITGPHG